MNLKEFAQKLNNKQYKDEVSEDERDLAYDLGFVVVYGASDDIMVIDGAIEGEASCYEGGIRHIDKDGLLDKCHCNCKYYEDAKYEAKVIEAVWDEGGYAWVYKTDIPHETFDIYEDEELYCKGIVFNINNL